MKLSGAETIKIICDREGIALKDLAGRLGCTAQNLNNKLKRDNFTINDFGTILDALGYDFDIVTMKK